jgi:hypothetical protein
MKPKIPFVVNYTKEDSEKFNKELKESGKCPITNPDFYGNWNLVEVGTPEYEEVFKKKIKNKSVD